MATAYHRRPIARGRDIAALANVKIGNGSAWQGFYMYVGGINPADHLQETHATGYPNDLPRFDYDFQAAIGATGRPGASLGLLRDHNAFLSAFGDRLADMYSSLPDDAPIDIHDLSRCAGQCAPTATADSSSSTRISRTSRSSGSSDVQFRIRPRAVTTSSFPIGRSTSPAGSSPAGRSASSSRVCESSGRRHPSRASSTGRSRRSCCARTTAIAARIRFAPGSRILTAGEEIVAEEPFDVEPGDSLLVDDALRVLVVDERQAERLWYLGEDLIDSPDAVWREPDGLVVRAEHAPDRDPLDG